MIVRRVDSSTSLMHMLVCRILMHHFIPAFRCDWFLLESGSEYWSLIGRHRHDDAYQPTTSIIVHRLMTARGQYRIHDWTLPTLLTIAALQAPCQVDHIECHIDQCFSCQMIERDRYPFESFLTTD